ncbi:MAG: proprotein convertase P-domain-containing protein [Isosphaeraceae bacterium]|nr:proprotein convertase P-domain-containing protein [Isosphaeraceae bacterium]
MVGLLACRAVGEAEAGSIIYPSEDIPKSIPDNDFTGITSLLVVPDAFMVSDLDLIFDELFHESVSDLRIALTSPMGTTVTLLKASSEKGILSGAGVVDNFIGTVLDDTAPTSLQDAFFDNHLGVYNIDHHSVGISPLALFNGESAQGTWTLRISDRVRFDAGVLNAWSLGFSSASTAPEPSGAVTALLGIGAGAAASWRKRIGRA